MSVEGIPQREEVVTFTRHHLSYNAGESASFTAEEAARLAELGVIDTGPPTDPPVNTVVPYVSQSGTMLTCTMGEWSNKPTAYAYQWQLDGVDAGTDAPEYDAAADAGKTGTCVVTATNEVGSTAAPPSNGVLIT